MAAVTTKRSKASAVKQASIKDTNAFLQSLPDKPKEDLSLREAVEQMRDSVRGALAKGYTYQELAAMLTDKGIKISAFTLKNYVPSGRRRSLKEQAAKQPVQRRGRKKAEAPAATPALVVETPSSAAKNGATPQTTEEAAKPAAKTPRGRSKVTTAAKAKSGSEATVKQPAAKPKRTTATPAASKSTSTRGRKKV